MKENKLIAEFMGGQYVDEHLIEFENFYSIKDIGDEFEYTNCFVSDNELKFHSSWDWLMPVVAKISRNEKYFEDEYREYILDVVPYGHIDDVFDAVVNFIKKIK